MSDYQICQLSEQEWQRAKAIRLRALSSAPTAFSAKLEEEKAFSDEEWQQRQSRKDVVFFVAQLCTGKQQDIGMVAGGPYNINAGLFSLWVDSGYRRLGMGSVLVDAVIRWATNQNYRRLLLDVRQSNGPAMQLYQAKRFRRTGRTHQLDFGYGLIDECQMALDLKSNKH